MPSGDIQTPATGKDFCACLQDLAAEQNTVAQDSETAAVLPPHQGTNPAIPQSGGIIDLSPTALPSPANGKPSATPKQSTSNPMVIGFGRAEYGFETQSILSLDPANSSIQSAPSFSIADSKSAAVTKGTVSEGKSPQISGDKAGDPNATLKDSVPNQAQAVPPVIPTAPPITLPLIIPELSPTTLTAHAPENTRVSSSSGTGSSHATKPTTAASKTLSENLTGDVSESVDGSDPDILMGESQSGMSHGIDAAANITSFTSQSDQKYTIKDAFAETSNTQAVIDGSTIKTPNSVAVPPELKNVIPLQNFVPQRSGQASPAIAGAPGIIVGQNGTRPSVPYGLLPMEVGFAALQGRRVLEVHLSPEDLGTVEIRLEVTKDSKAKAELRAEKPETLALLMQDAPSLRNALDQAGMTTSADSLQFSLRQDQQSSNNQNQFSGNGQQNNNPPLHQRQETETLPAAPQGELSPRMISRVGLLDVNI